MTAAEIIAGLEQLITAANPSQPWPHGQAISGPFVVDTLTAAADALRATLKLRDICEQMRNEMDAKENQERPYKYVAPYGSLAKMLNFLNENPVA